MKYINYEIKNLEPIKLTSTIMQGDNEFTKSYISGANLRGAFIANYISMNKGININSGRDKEMILKGGIKFFNAYPVSSDGRRGLPVPRCFYAEKHKIKNLKKLRELDVINHNSNLDKNKDYVKIKGFEFVNWNIKENQLNPITLDKLGSLHIRKGQGNENKLFRYEAVKEGQSFKGIICCEDDNYVNIVINALENGLFYVGGSKGSGYGLCEIKDIKIESSNEELDIIQNNNYLNEITVVATSDIICRDELGVYKSNFSNRLLEDELGNRVGGK